MIDKKKTQKRSKKDSVRTVWFSLTIITMSIYLLWRLFFTLPFEEGIIQTIFGIVLFVAETITAMTTFELYYRKVNSGIGKLEFPEIPDSYFPHIDVFIATHNESTVLLYKTANACTFMEYPDKDKVHIYFADDKNRPEVEALARMLGIGYLGLPNNKNAKSGNLNNALSKTDSPLIATLDADMIPRRRFLLETVPYFLLPDFIKDGELGKWRLRTESEKNPNMKIGLIQTPQSFYSPDLFQFNLYAEKTIPNEQDFFSREVNVLRNSSNSTAYTGSNTVISRKALTDIGGFPLKTITEDFETSIRIQKEGYITYATEKTLAAGLTTMTVRSMIRQRTRWARGVIQSIKNTNAVFTRKLNIGAKLTYLNAFLYWWSFFFRIVFILAPILFALFDFRVVNCDFRQLVIFWLPSYIFYSYSMRWLSSNIRNQRWSQTIDTILAPSLIIPVFLETIGIHERKFKVTSKNPQAADAGRLLYAAPHLLLLILSLLALIRYIRGKYGMALFYSSIIIFWLCYNMISLLYSLFFIHGRKFTYDFVSIKGEERIVLKNKNKTATAVTVSFSDEHLIFKAEKNLELSPEEKFDAFVKTKYYEAGLDCKIINCQQDTNEKKWYYSAYVVPKDEKNKRQYMQIMYDRRHSLPKELDKWTTAYDDFYRNIVRRVMRKKSKTDELI